MPKPDPQHNTQLFLRALREHRDGVDFASLRTAMDYAGAMIASGYAVTIGTPPHTDKWRVMYWRALRKACEAWEVE